MLEKELTNVAIQKAYSWLKEPLPQISLLLPIHMGLSLKKCHGYLARTLLQQRCLLFNSRKSASCPRAKEDSKEELDLIKKIGLGAGSVARGNI